MARRQIRIMVDGDRVLAEAARRLHHEHDVARLQGRDHDLALRIRLRSTNSSPGAGPQCFTTTSGARGQRGEPVAIVLGRQPDRVALQLSGGQPVGVLTAGARSGHGSGRRRRRRPRRRMSSDRISVLAHGAQQRDGAGGGVEADGVADPGVFGRIGREHQRDPLLAGPRWRVAARAAPRGRRRGRSARGRRRTRSGPSSSISLNENGTVMIRPSNSGTATWVATSSGDSPSSLCCHCARELVRHRPCRIGTSSAARCADVPGLVVATGRDGGRSRPAGGEHRRHQRVGGAEQLEKRGVRCAQRRAEHRQRPAAGLLDGPAQRLDVAGVTGEVLGAVVEHRDGRAVGIRRGPLEDSPVRGGRGRSESVAGQQHRVAQERVQLPQILHARPAPGRRATAERLRRASWNGPSARRPGPARR